MDDRTMAVSLNIAFEGDVIESCHQVDERSPFNVLTTSVVAQCSKPIWFDGLSAEFILNVD